LNKTGRRRLTIPVKYAGFDIGNEFVIGYGLDYDQMYRNLPFIGKVISRS
jgi:hypoxanthine phosphoribosyltransferase